MSETKRARTGGRQKGTRNKRTAELQAKVAATGWTPLDVMLHTMRIHVNAQAWDKAANVAKDVAPYIHPKLSQIDAKHTGDMGITLTVISGVPRSPDEPEDG